MSDIDKEFLHLARLMSENKTKDSAALIRKTLRDILKRRPELSEQAEKILSKTNQAIHQRSFISPDPIPVDVDSRLELIKRENDIQFEIEPVWSPSVLETLEAVIAERKQEAELFQAGLVPTKTMLLVGPPGVGKTLSARWLASKLNRPFLVLDLAAVMSSYLGKTGNNIRSVLEFAQRQPSLLLLDEFDAVAKRRDDSGEVGELKRLVTVLLQSVDEWPADGLLLAATNHPELLDPAVWRRFDRIVEFPKPSPIEQEKYVRAIFETAKKPLGEYLPILTTALDGLTYAEIEKQMKSLLRESIINKQPIEKCLDRYLAETLKSSEIKTRLKFAHVLKDRGYSQREIHTLTGCSRDTLRKQGVATKNSESISSKESEL